ncbi:MAG: AraC family transcriptional regulator [Burkholderiales bacterium]|nr:AraC family transcriptional regulator [Anaerolineae bacterium]
MQEQHDNLFVRAYCALIAQNAGLFISRGAAMHPTRVIESHELIFVQEGELDMWEDEQEFHLEAGDTLHLWPGRQHGSTKPMPLGLRFYWIHFEIETRSENSAENGDEFHPAPAINMPQLARLNQPERLGRLFRTFLDDQETGMLNSTSANLLTMLMLIEVAQASEERPMRAFEQNVLATWAHTYIRINYARPITTSKVAEALGFNADYLGRIYRKVYGCTLTEAIHRSRIHVACKYLLDNDLTAITIDQIAQKCGFSDPDYFRRIFRRYMKIAPGDYRREFSHIHVNTH